MQPSGSTGLKKEDFSHPNSQPDPTSMNTSPLWSPAEVGPRELQNRCLTDPELPTPSKEWRVRAMHVHSPSSNLPPQSKKSNQVVEQDRMVSICWNLKKRKEKIATG